MAHRLTDQHHVREATHVHGDEIVDQSRNALEAIARGDYKRDRVETTAPEGETWTRRTPQAVHAAIARDAIAPRALAVACLHAEPGAYCWPQVRGLCGDRIHRGIRAAIA